MGTVLLARLVLKVPALYRHIGFLYELLARELKENLFQGGSMTVLIGDFFEVVRCIEGNDATTVHDGYPVTEDIRFGHVVCSQHEGRIVTIPKLSDKGLYLSFRSRIKTSRRFVKEEQHWRTQQRSGNCYFLLHAPRHFFHRPVDILIRDVQPFKDRYYLSPYFTALDAIESCSV